MSGMMTSLKRITQIIATLGILGATSAFPAVAAVRHNVHGRGVHRIHHSVAPRPLTVTRQYRPDPFHGPAAIITAPVAVAGMIVGLPFQAIGAVFPPAVNDPRVVVGAPVYAAGRIAQFPFYAIDSAFGVPPGYY
jgi:hypothetical protein